MCCSGVGNGVEELLYCLALSCGIEFCWIGCASSRDIASHNKRFCMACIVLLLWFFFGWRNNIIFVISVVVLYCASTGASSLFISLCPHGQAFDQMSDVSPCFVIALILVYHWYMVGHSVQCCLLIRPLLWSVCFCSALTVFSALVFLPLFFLYCCMVYHGTAVRLRESHLGENCGSVDFCLVSESPVFYFFYCLVVRMISYR